VATTVANEGVGARDGEEIVLRDDERGFADAVVELLCDDGARERLGRAARAFVERSWTWEAMFDRQLQALVEIARS
jgi:glycosyltransferase involved in cell wall biosynthesis